MNAYASIADIKTALGVTSTTDDVVMRKIVEAASRMIDIYTNRFFYVQSATKTFDGVGSRLWVDDLLSINASGLKTDEHGDLDYHTTLATTDYIVYPLNTFPKTRIEISDQSNYSSFAGGIKSGVQIAGKFGYGDGISATPYISDTTTNDDLTAGETDITVTAVTNLSPGQTILIESEQYFIYSISSLVLTVEPGVNGTTQATHATGKTIYIYQYPYDIWQACINMSSAIYQNRDKQGIQSAKLGDYEYNLISPYSEGGRVKAAITTIMDDTISGYRKVRI